jgi:excisionase family DNA binding protein
VPKKAPSVELPIEPLLLDIRGTARVLSSTVWTVRSLLWNGEIPFIKIGRKFLITPEDLRTFIEQKKAADL